MLMPYGLLPGGRVSREAFTVPPDGVYSPIMPPTSFATTICPCAIAGTSTETAETANAMMDMVLNLNPPILLPSLCAICSAPAEHLRRSPSFVDNTRDESLYQPKNHSFSDFSEAKPKFRLVSPMAAIAESCVRVVKISGKINRAIRPDKRSRSDLFDRLPQRRKIRMSENREPVSQL